MEISYWLSKWKKGETGFHAGRVNPALESGLPLFDLKPGEAVLVPLCGKTLDMHYLAGKGLHVYGVEVSEKALEEFIRESGKTFGRSSEDGFTVYRAPGITLYKGDYFKMKPGMLPSVRFCYDRAALVALPPQMRAKYAAHTANLLPIGAEMLLLSFEYDQDLMKGPPFSVPEKEVRRLYEPYFDVYLIEREQYEEVYRKFAANGLTSMAETRFRLIKL